MKLYSRFFAASLAVSLAFTPVAADVVETPGSAEISELVTRLLEQSHYAHRPIDADISKQFLVNYLESFDYNHMIFEQSDVDEFTAKYGATLGQKAKAGEIEPAFEIYQRALTRLESRVAFIKKLAGTNFTFTNNDAIVLDRHELPWPASPKEAEELWRLRIKYEVLTEKMSRDKIASDKAAAAKADAAHKPKAAKAAPAVKPAVPVKESTIEETIATRYDRVLHGFKEYDGSDILQDYLSALSHVYDPHTDYMAANSKDNFDISMKLSLVGIGAVLRTEDDYAQIVSLVPGGPADKSKKLKANDKIEAVAQGDMPFVEVLGMKLDRVVSIIRGEKDTTVRLRIIPADAVDPSTRVIVSIVREEVKLTDQEAKARIYNLPIAGKGSRPVRIGYLDLPTFYADMRGGDGAKSMSRDAQLLIGEMQKRGIDGLIVDIRGNIGGALAEGVTFTGLFVKDGPVVQVKDARGSIHVLRDTDPQMTYDGPMVVLTSRGSASAAEIFAAAMQDYGRAVLVGDKSTFGKGTVQQVLDLGQYMPPAFHVIRPGALKLTIQKFYRVSGGSTQNRGVIPDIHLPSRLDISEMTESSQKNALPYDAIEPAPSTRSAMTDGKIPALLKASNERTATSKEFQWIHEDLMRWQKQKDEKIFSLNEQKRDVERKAEDDIIASRKKARIALKIAPLKFDEITLENLDGKTVDKSTPTATVAAAGLDDDEDYERAPDVPDAILEEGLHITQDLIGLVAPTPETAQRNDAVRVTQ